MKTSGKFLNDFISKLGNFYSGSSFAQDLVETGIGTGVSAAGQLLFTDMSPQEIALSSLLGAGAAMGVRPIAARAGRAVGRRLPESWNQGLEAIQASMGPALPIPTKHYLDAMDNEIKALRSMGDKQGADFMEKMMPVLRSKYKAEFEGRTPLEGTLGYGARLYGDNLAQFGVAAMTPFFFGEDDNQNELASAQIVGYDYSK